MVKTNMQQSKLEILGSGTSTGRRQAPALSHMVSEQAQFGVGKAIYGAGTIPPR